MKKFFKTVATVFVAIVLIFVLPRYGWRIFGFSRCDFPNALYAQTVSVENGLVRIKGGTVSSASAYVGHIYSVEDSNLYVGVKHNLLLGFINRLGDFNITISVNAANIKNVYFKGGGNEKLIWNTDEGLIRAIRQATQSTGSASED